jgi:uncharacterized protein YxeA
MRYSLITILFCIIALTSIQAQDITFTAQAKNAVLAGEKFQLIYNVNDEGEDLRLPSLPDFTVIMGPTSSYSSSIQIINGKYSRSKQYTYTYLLKCDKPGKYKIGPAQITISGEKYESNALSIEVVKNDQKATSGQQQSQAQSSSSSFAKDDLFISVTPNKKNIYQGEPVVLTTKIYTRINLDNISDIKHPDYRNFIVQDLSDNTNLEWTYEFINNKQYRVGVLEQKVLFPQNSGKQTINATEIEFLIKQRVARRSRSIFDDFFEDPYRIVKKRVASKPVSINVKPFPYPKPNSFSGGVGNLSMKVNTSKNKVKANDGITIKVVISGTGNHKLISEPKFNFPPDFDTFEPTVKNNFTNTIAGMKGTKTFEYLIIPRYGGDYKIDPLQFTFFNPKSAEYVTIIADPISIEVEKINGQEAIEQGYVPSATSREDIKFVGKDIRFINTQNTHLKEKGTFFFGSVLFYIGYIIPLLILVIAFLLYKKKIHEDANIHLVKSKKANKMATKRLKKSSEFLKANNHEAFYEEVLKACYTYLSDKLYLPVSELSKENTANILIEKGVSKETESELMDILNQCEFARFSPSSGDTAQMDKLYHRAINTIISIDNQLKML